MSCSMVSAQEAIDMSLDEYIVKTGSYVSPMLRQPRLESFNTRTSRVEDPDVDDDIEIDEALLKNGDTNDLRPKISNKGIKQENVNNFNNLQNLFGNEPLPAINSQQWRLIPLNTSSKKRPAGMPPLVMRDAAGPFNVCGRSRSNANNSGSNIGIKRKNNKNKFKNKNMPANGFKKNAFNNFLNSRQNNGGLPINGTKPQDLSISVSAKSINHCTTMPNNVQSNEITSNVDLLKKFRNLPLSKDIIPMLAKNLLEQLQPVPPIIPQEEKYDLQIQEQIHMLQNKPFIYKCGNQEKPSVLSYDGPGVNHTIHPSTTGVSLNQRFG